MEWKMTDQASIWSLPLQENSQSNDGALSPWSNQDKTLVATADLWQDSECVLTTLCIRIETCYTVVFVGVNRCFRVKAFRSEILRVIFGSMIDKIWCTKVTSIRQFPYSPMKPQTFLFTVKFTVYQHMEIMCRIWHSCIMHFKLKYHERHLNFPLHDLKTVSSTKTACLHSCLCFHVP